MSISLIFLILALVCFVVATFNVPAPVNLIAAGLALLTVASLVLGTGPIRL